MPTLDDVAIGAHKYISTLTDVLALIGAFPADDPVVANRNLPWIFKDDIIVRMEGTGLAALVCRHGGGWGAARPLNTERFMRLNIDIYVDPSRDSGRNITESSGGTILRGNNLFSVLNSHLHRRNPDRVAWGDLVTTSCDLLSEPTVWTKVSDGDMLLMGTATYGVMSYGWTDASV
jgi:hypothetical protein